MILSFLILLSALTRAIGDFREPVYGLLTLLALGFFWKACPRVPTWNRLINWLFKWSTLLLAAGLLRWAPPPLSLALATAVCWIFSRYAQNPNREILRPLALTGALYTFWWTVFFQLPAVYHLITGWSYGYTEWITGAMAGRLILGPSAAAVDLLILGICGLAATATLEGKPRWSSLFVSLVLLEAGRIIYIWLAPTLMRELSRLIPVSTTPHLDMPGVYLLFVAGVLTLHWRTAHIGRSSVTPSDRSARTWRLAGAAIVLLTLIAGGAASYTSNPVRVLFLDRRTLDFSVPAFGRYGDRSGGMFGFLPKFLHEAGYDFRRQDLTPGILDSVDVVIIANLLEKFSPTERQQMWDFIEGGGGLIILGDHTGTDAIRDPTNDLIAPSGISLNFDTAVPLRRSWAAEKFYLFHPLGRSGGIMDGELWLGASVDPGPRGEPFLVGRGGISDPGDINNPNRAYLGNLAYDPGEPLGDVALAAAAHWGRGKVILFGDTSPWQNGTIVRSHSLITRSIQWVARDGWNDFLDRWRSWILLALIGVGGAVLVIRSAGSAPLFFLALLTPVAGVSLWGMIPGPRSTDWRGEEYRLALLDVSHGQKFDGMSWEPQSVGGLEFNLMRNGYSMRISESPSDIGRFKPDLYVLFAPTRPLSGNTVERLVQFMEEGGWVIAAAGWNLRHTVAPLLERFDLEIENVPLGQIGGRAMGDTVKLADAYPVAVRPRRIAEPLIESFGYPVAQRIPYGKGGLVVIGDSQFFYNKNLEGQNELVVLENVFFFREMLRRTAGTSAP